MPVRASERQRITTANGIGLLRKSPYLRRRAEALPLRDNTAFDVPRALKFWGGALRGLAFMFPFLSCFVVSSEFCEVARCLPTLNGREYYVATSDMPTIMKLKVK